jgi:hypothetical protein
MYGRWPISNRNNLQTSVSKWSPNITFFRLNRSVYLSLCTDHRIYQPFKYSWQSRILCLGIWLFWNNDFHFKQYQSCAAASCGTLSICRSPNRWYWACLSLDCATCFNDHLDWPPMRHRVGLLAKYWSSLFTSKFSDSNNWSISVKMRIKQILISKFY